MKSKKGFANPFDISSRIGYYVLGMMLISIIFLFSVVLIRGTDITFYKSNYGSAVINLEEKVFNLIEYEDCLTNNKYSKIIDLEKFNQYKSETLFDSKIGVENEFSRKGVKASLYSFNSTDSLILRNEISTSNYAQRETNIEKVFPVFVKKKDSTEYEVMLLKMRFWKP